MLFQQLRWSVLISPLNYIQNIIFFIQFFGNIVILCFFVTLIFVVVKERVVNSQCIFMLFFGICSSFFGVLIRAILERVCQSCNIYNAPPFLFCSFESICLSTYLPAIYLPICLYKVICPSFPIAVLSAEIVPFI